MAISEFLFLDSSSGNVASTAAVPEMIHILRKHLGMDIAFVGEFTGGNRQIRLVDSEEENCAIRVGTCSPEQESYCKLIIDGRLPHVMNRVDDYPLAAALSVTKELGIGSYLAAPIHLSDGTIYGTLCCYSHAPEPSLNHRDLAMIKACAEMTAKQIEKHRQSTSRQHETRRRIEGIFTSDALHSVYQPILDLACQRIVGFEALSRFKGMDTGPDTVFRDAYEVGLGCSLEVMAIKSGLDALAHIASDLYVAFNVSPEALLDPEFAQVFANMPMDRITLEITEHAAVEHYQEILSALIPLRRDGMQLAVDDAGAGFASFRHILELAPDKIKLDACLTKNIEGDPSRRALIAAFVQFAGDTGSKLIAEGVETDAQLNALKELGVEKIQGNLIGKPMPLDEAVNISYKS